MRNDEIHLRHDVASRAEIGCLHFAGVFALGASVELMQSIGIENIQSRVLKLNRALTSRLDESGWKVLSPLGEEKFRSAETLVSGEEPAKIVAHLAQQNILVTEKPQGIRVSTDFFNDEDDIEKLLHRLHGFH
jgi:selenocysteine lyase/cysteine desulfurase